MAAKAIIRCPKCEKKFKGKPGLEGKKIRCPLCEGAFVVTDEVISAAKPAKAAAPPVPAAAKSAAEPPPPAAIDPFGEEDEGPNEYGVTHTDLQARCPNCANPLESDRDVICLWCGYNLQTRAVGKTEKLIAHTPSEILVHLLPGLFSFAFIVMQTILILYYCLVLPVTIDPDSWLTLLDHESLRMWVVILSLFAMWPAGVFAFNRLVLHPTPPKKAKE